GRGRLLWGPLVSSSARLRKPAAESPRGGAAPGRPEPAGATRRERPLESSRAGLPWSLGGARHAGPKSVELPFGFVEPARLRGSGSG
ncbi:unnamed protein product, partial [Prorocentrum cordatum]